MFETYPDTFKINIYPSRRSCAVPPEVLELTDKNASLINCNFLRPKIST